MSFDGKGEPVKIKLLKYLDRFLGRLLVLLIPTPVKKDLDSPKTVLLIRPGGIGDAVLLIPTILSLRVAFPAIQIDILAEKRNSQIFRLSPEVSSVYCYDKLADFWRVLTSRYDLVIDTEQWHRLSAIIASLIRSRRKIGFGTNERAKLFTDVIDYSHNDYEGKSFLNLLHPLQLQLSSNISSPFLHIPTSIRSSAEILGADFGRYVVLFPGASIQERRWGADRFTALAALLNNLGLTVVVIGGGEDRTTGEAIVVKVATAVNLAGKTTLLESAAVLRDAQLLVSGDSGILHIGVGLGTPTVSLFGPGIAAKWAPPGKHHRIINLDLPCSPCTQFGTTPPCPIEAKCLQDISATEVFSAAKELLGKNSKKS